MVGAPFLSLSAYRVDSINCKISYSSEIMKVKQTNNRVLTYLTNNRQRLTNLKDMLTTVVWDKLNKQDNNMLGKN